MSPTNVIIPNSFSMDWPERYISPTLSRAYRILSNAFLVKNRGISPWMLDENFPFFAPVATCMGSNPQPTALCAIPGSANKRFLFVRIHGLATKLWRDVSEIRVGLGPQLQLGTLAVLHGHHTIWDTVREFSSEATYTNRVEDGNRIS